MIMWWNIPYCPIKSVSGDELLKFVEIDQITNLKPAHEVHLCVNAQIYSLIVGKNILAICQNDGITTFYKSCYTSMLEEEKVQKQEIKVVQKDDQLDQKNRTWSDFKGNAPVEEQINTESIKVKI